MKISLILLLAFFSNTFYSQTTMEIRKLDGTLIVKPISEIDSMKFNSVQSTHSLDIYLNNQVSDSYYLNDIDSITYTINNFGIKPYVITLSVDTFSSFHAVLLSNLISEGSSPVTAQGVCYSLTPNPQITDNVIHNDVSIGLYSSFIAGLQPLTTYYVSAFATNSFGTSYGKQLTFMTSENNFNCDDINTQVIDIDGNIYNVIRIGNLCWTSENIKTSRYANGNLIPNISNNEEWVNLNSAAWCNYENNNINDQIYGKLYNWYAIADPQSICPLGWRVPSDEDWKTLEFALGMDAVELDEVGWRGENDNVGGKMKSNTEWQSPNTGANNLSGFSALPGGYRNDGSGSYIASVFSGSWWRNTELDSENVWYLTLNYNNSGVSRASTSKKAGFSVRCVRD